METQTTSEKITSIVNVVLNATALSAEKVTQTFSLVHKLHPETLKPYRLLSREITEEIVEQLTFPLREVSKEEIKQIRRNCKPGFVLKKDEKYFYAEIIRNIIVNSAVVGAHKCAASNKECNRLSAASDELGGCAKVRRKSTGIENFSFIKTGTETFNTNHDSLVVIECDNYEKCPPRKTYTPTELNHMRLAIAQYIMEDATCLGEVQARVQNL